MPGIVLTTGNIAVDNIKLQTSFYRQKKNQVNIVYHMVISAIWRKIGQRGLRLLWGRSCCFILVSQGRPD